MRTELRQRLRATRDGIEEVERQERSRAACARMLEAIAKLDAPPATVALYRAMGSELALDALVEGLAGRVRLAAPVTLTHGRLAFVEVCPHELLAGTVAPDFLAHPWQPVEKLPLGRVEVTPTEIGLFVVPGMGFDLDGGRLGYGGGYYDRYLGRPDCQNIPRWGVAFREQLCERVPMEAHDARMDRVFLG